MTAGGHRYRLTGSLTVPLPPEEAFDLFTPRGEQVWVDGWHPRFPDPGVDDDTEPGTVFETGHGVGTTTWVVLDRERGRRISYARVTPGDRAGTVALTVLPAADGHSEVRVTYTLTALADATRGSLADFADAYPDHLRSWQDAIAAHLSGHSAR